MNNSAGAGELLSRASIIFWDFDGVIKESLDIKSNGFEQLFLPYGTDVAVRVRAHHEANGGVSRYEKIKLYLGWIGESPDAARVGEFCDRFSSLVCDAVIQCQWVPGVYAYLAANHERQKFVVVTGTPQREIEHILGALRITDWFCEVHGAPTPKDIAIQQVLQRLGCAARECLVIGDSATDLAAAESNDLPFLLRRTSQNGPLQSTFMGTTFRTLN